jgi:hypothetical protein
MKSIVSFFKLKKEAVFLDSGLYILKAFAAVMAAYYIAYHNPILKLDIISVLFGLMLTLEPVNLTGIRNGLSQVYATCLGALSTAIIIYVGGINIITIALSIAFTLYVCLKIDWRAVSPVAIFTSIYMTQYVQKTPLGEPSILLTFRLRIFALIAGVVLAIIFNYLFSRFYYSSMVSRRLAFLLHGLQDNINLTKEGIEKDDLNIIKKSKLSLPSSFNNIDWVFSLFNDMKKEYSPKKKAFNISIAELDKLVNIILFMRSIAHLNYDINYVLLEERVYSRIHQYKNKLFKDLSFIAEELKYLIVNIEDNGVAKFKGKHTEGEEEDLSIYKDEQQLRIFQDISSIKSILYKINRELSNTKS